MKKLFVFIFTTAFSYATQEPKIVTIVDPTNPAVKFYINMALGIKMNVCRQGRNSLSATLQDGSKIDVHLTRDNQSYYFHAPIGKPCDIHQTGLFLYTTLNQLRINPNI